MIVSPSGFCSSIPKTLSVQSITTLSRFLCNSSSEGSISQESSSISATFVSYLENCTDIQSVRKLHACIFTYGLGNSILLGSKLLNCYANFDCLTESRWVFTRIINRNLSLWNSILVGYFRTGHFNEVLRLYSNLKQQSIIPGSSAITFTLKSSTELGTVKLGRGIHLDAFKFSLNTDRFVGSSLIRLYAKHGDIEDARRVFEEISNRDVVAYTAMITGYAQLADRRAYEAFKIVCYMQKEGLDPNRVTVVSLFQAAARLEALQAGRSVHGYAVRRGVDCLEEVLETSLVDMYIKCGALNIAASIFSRMNTRTVASWNALISGHVQSGQPLEALEIIYLMVQENLMPDSITLANGLLACADLKFLNEGKSIHCYIIRTAIHLDLVATTALIDMYSKCNSINQARKLFNRMETRDIISFSVMMSGYLHCGSAYDAIETFCGMFEAGIKPNLATILSILSASADLTDIRKGRSVHGYTVRQGLEFNTEIANQILYTYAKCGFIHIARQVFSRMTDRDLVSWTSMINACVQNGLADEAIEFFQMMQGENMDSDSVTLISLLQAFSQLGCLRRAKEVQSHVYRVFLEREIPINNSLVTTYAKCGRLDMAKNLFEHTIGRGLTTWNTMIAAYGMHGKCIEALRLFDRMQEENVTPDEITFTSILSACSHTGLVEEGKRVFHSMKEKYFMIPCEEHYGCMVDLLGRAGRLEEAYDLVKCQPPRESASALAALLAACRIYRNTEMGEVIGRQLLDLEPENPGVYTLVSNIYAEAGKWDEVARLRTIAMRRGLKKIPGYSLIELDKQFCGM